MSYLFIFLIFFIVTLINIHLFYRIFKTKKILTINDDFKRRNIVNSAGIILILQTIIVLIYLNYFSEFRLLFEQNLPRPYMFIISIFILGFFSLIDDVKNLDFRIRLIVQFSIIFASLSLITFDTQSTIPLKIQQYIAIIIWVYILNSINFIDGLDGFLLIKVITITLIILVKYLIDQQILISTILSFILLPFALATITMNFPKAKIFLGDTGSIFFGFVIGFIFFELLINKSYFIAISILLYPITDVTITLIKKIIKGRKPWSRDFDYFFLMKVIKYKKNHTSVTFPFIIYNLFLLFNCFLIIYFKNFYYFILNILLIMFFLYFLRKK